ncbi:MAG: molybdopterin-containing oxidoreductase family protein, partial [Alphaproteobacteria bacterium]
MAMAKTVTPTMCWECSTHCGALVTTEDGRVTKVAPNPDHPASRGAFCIKGIRGLPELTYHKDRLLYPLRRTGERGEGRWRRISWDEALDEMAQRFLSVREEHGPLAIAGAVSNANFSRGVMVALLMRTLGSPNWLMNQDLCGGCRAVSDRITGITITGGEDIDNTDCALIVGRNPQAADPVQWTALKKAQARGAKIVVIDPARTPAAKMADLWLQPRPGADAAIALAMIHVVITEDLHDRDFVERWCHGFDRLAERAAQYPPEVASRISGVAADDIIAAAHLYAAGPGCFVSGHGIDAFSNGVQTFRAFHSLLAICGNMDRKGGNRRVKKPKGFRNYLEVLHDKNFRLPLEVEQQTIGAERFPLWAGPRGWQTACHNPSAIEAILTGEPYALRAMYVSGVNIVVTYPDTQKTMAALKSLDFLVVASHMMTPTAELADIVLPKTTGLEDEEISYEAGPCLSITQPVIEPLGETRSDFDIAHALVRHLETHGLNDARRFLRWNSKREFSEFLLGDCAITIEELADKGYAEYSFDLGNFEEVGFNTPSGKIELYSETLAELGLEPLPEFALPRTECVGEDILDEYPLVLLTGAREKTYHHSRFREQDWARKVSPHPKLQINPETAAHQGVKTGEWVAVQTRDNSGSCHLVVDITGDVAPGVLRTGMGWWYPEAAGPERGALEVNINAAMSYGAPWDPVSGSADTRGIPCRITRAEA